LAGQSHLAEDTDVQKKYHGYYFGRRWKIGGRQVIEKTSSQEGETLWEGAPIVFTC